MPPADLSPNSDNSGIVDLRSSRLERPDAPGSSGEPPLKSERGALFSLQAPTIGDDGEAVLALRYTQADFARIQQYGRWLKAQTEQGLPLESDSSADPLQRIWERLALASVEGEVVHLDPDFRGPDYDCINAYFCSALPKELERIDESALRLPPLEPECRASICIPVAAHEEGRFIYRTLKAFTNQTVSPSTFEIVLYLNHPIERKDGSKVAPDATLDEVARFQRDYPHIRVRAFYDALPPDEAKIGPIRRFLNDVVLARHFRRGTNLPEHILIRADADTHGVKPKFLENYLRLFERNPHIDAFKGKLDWDWGAYLKDPVLLFGTRFFLALDAFIDATRGRIGGGGANFAIRAARYADCGGYDSTSDMAEDVQLGSAIKRLREGAQSHIAIASAGAHSRLWTDNRRGAAALMKGHAPVCQWHNGDTNFGAENAEIRSVPLPESGRSYLELLHAPDFHERISRVIQQTVDFYCIPSDPERAKYVEHVMPKLGIHATLGENGKIEVGDISGLIRSLALFHELAPDYWAEQLGFDPIA